MLSLADGPLAVLRRTQDCTAQELDQLARAYRLRAAVAESCQALADRAYGRGEAAALAEVHAILALVYDDAFSAAAIADVDREQPFHADVRTPLERAVLAHELSRIADGQLPEARLSGRAFVRWLKATVSAHPAGWHPLYHQHLAERGSVEDLRLLLAQETNLDPRFDDILAAMQTGRSGHEKLELAANYWDEMGNGDPGQVHTALFAQALAAIGVDSDYVKSTLLPEARVSGNISACLALSRRHYYKAVGYFGVTEYLAPRRFRCVVDTWRRHDLDEVGIVYHELHIGVDAGHAAGWFKNVIMPLVDDDPRAGPEIARGALIRLNTSQDYLDALLRSVSAASGVGAV
jgi:hypothetical protein